MENLTVEKKVRGIFYILILSIFLSCNSKNEPAEPDFHKFFEDFKIAIVKKDLVKLQSFIKFPLKVLHSKEYGFLELDTSLIYSIHYYLNEDFTPFITTYDSLNIKKEKLSESKIGNLQKYAKNKVYTTYLIDEKSGEKLYFVQDSNSFKLEFAILSSLIETNSNFWEWEETLRFQDFFENLIKAVKNNDTEFLSKCVAEDILNDPNKEPNEFISGITKKQLLSTNISQFKKETVGDLPLEMLEEEKYFIENNFKLGEVVFFDSYRYRSNYAATTIYFIKTESGFKLVKTLFQTYD